MGFYLPRHPSLDGGAADDEREHEPSGISDHSVMTETTDSESTSATSDGVGYAPSTHGRWQEVWSNNERSLLQQYNIAVAGENSFGDGTPPAPDPNQPRETVLMPVPIGAQPDEGGGQRTRRPRKRKGAAYVR